MGIATWNRILTLTGRLFDRKHSTVPLVPPTVPKPLFSDVPTQQLVRVSPESQGLSSKEIAAFFTALKEDETLDMHSVTVLRNGYVVAEASFGDWDRTVWQATFSACKSLVSLAIGLLVDDGYLRVEDRVVDFFSEELNALTRLKWRDLTVEHLLTMRSGTAFNEFGAVSEDDWVKNFFTAPLSVAVGAEFRYNSLNTYMLAVLVKKIAGKSVNDLLRERLFDPMGIGDVYWETCPRGVEKGGWGLYIRPEDLAKLGQLVMQRGVWQGERLLSAAWITAATTKQVSTPLAYGDYDYGYQFWTSRDGHRFLFNGMLGQNVLGFWDNGVVIVSHAGNNEMFQQSRYFTLVHQAFDKPFPASLAADTAAEARLQETIASLRATYPARPKPSFWQRLIGAKGKSLPPICERLHNATYAVTASAEASSVGLLPLSLQMVTNRYTNGLEKLRFVTDEDRFVLFYSEGEEEHCLPIGFFAPCRTVLCFGGDAYLVSVSGRFATDEEDHPVLFLRLCFLETPYTRYLKCTFCQDTLRLAQRESPGEQFVHLLAADVKADIEKQPLVGGAVQKLDIDYLDYKLERLFSPGLTLQLIKPKQE